jgi:hypothetical protein
MAAGHETDPDDGVLRLNGISGHRRPVMRIPREGTWLFAVGVSAVGAVLVLMAACESSDDVRISGVDGEPLSRTLSLVGRRPTADRACRADGECRESYRPAIARRQRNASVGERVAIVYAFTRDGEPGERVDLTLSSSTTGDTPCEFAALGTAGLKPYPTGS